MMSLFDVVPSIVLFDKSIVRDIATFEVTFCLSPVNVVFELIDVFPVDMCAFVPDTLIEPPTTAFEVNSTSSKYAFANLFVVFPKSYALSVVGMILDAKNETASTEHAGALFGEYMVDSWTGSKIISIRNIFYVLNNSKYY